MGGKVYDGGSRFPDFDDTNAFARQSKRAPPGGVAKDALGVPLAAKLPVTTANIALPILQTVGVTTPRIGRGGGQATDYVEFVNTVADLSYPRLINVWSEVRRDPFGVQFTTSPFQMHVSWTSGGGKGGQLWCTGSGGGVQLFINAKSLRIDLANWDALLTPQVFLSIQEGSYGQTQDLHYIMREINLAPGAFIDFGLVPFAREVIVNSANPAQRGNIIVALMDAQAVPTVQSAFLATDTFISCGSASKIRVINNDPAPLTSYTLDFRLGYE